MQYDAIISREGDNYLVEFPDAVGCQTFAESADDVIAAAREALEGWLEANLADGRVPPRPEHRRAAPVGSSLSRITVNPILSVALQVRWARQDKGLSQAQLAELVGVTQQQIAKLEDPDANPTLGTLQRVSDALHLEVHLSLEDLMPFAETVATKSSRDHIRVVGPTRSATRDRSSAFGGSSTSTTRRK